MCSGVVPDVPSVLLVKSFGILASRKIPDQLQRFNFFARQIFPAWQTGCPAVIQSLPQVVKPKATQKIIFCNDIPGRTRSTAENDRPAGQTRTGAVHWLRELTTTRMRIERGGNLRPRHRTLNRSYPEPLKFIGIHTW